MTCGWDNVANACVAAYCRCKRHQSDRDVWDDDIFEAERVAAGHLEYASWIARLNPPSLDHMDDDELPPCCTRCGGAGWVWWDALDDYDGPAAYGGADDARYPCPACPTRDMKGLDNARP